jgi:lipopolysaccharide biosynthesis regulator YciM
VPKLQPRRPLPTMLAEPSPALILGLFVAVAAGWALGRRGAMSRRPQPTALSSEYLQGLRFLLNEEPDKALEVFLRMVDVDNETVETHFALGKLFRRRGEVDRAIRIHENIMGRASLSAEHRSQAMFALAEDFFHAGLFDRAETLFQQLAGEGVKRAGALRYLLRIYELQRDWEQAIDAHQKLVAIASPEHPTAIAHYYCELADRARTYREFELARTHLRRAREAQRNFPRGALLRADVALDMGDPTLAALLCQRVVELHPKLLPLALPRVLRALREESSDVIAQRFSAWIRPEPTARAELAYAGIVAGLEREAFVLECLPDLLREEPTLGELARALAGEPAQYSPEQRQELASALGRILRRTQRYRCVECGFASAAHFWQCPGCRSWDAFAPVALLDVTPGVYRR